MKLSLGSIFLGAFVMTSLNLSAQTYKADRLRNAVDILGLQIAGETLMPDTTISLKAKDGQFVILRTDPMGRVEHVGIKLFDDMLRLLQPSPVYDFLEYAVLTWKYKVNKNQLYLSKVIFKKGGWETLLRESLNDCVCSIENHADKLYVITWKRRNIDVAIVGIPIEYELLNNDTRRNMERAFVENLENSSPVSFRPKSAVVSEESLSIYGTEGLFVIPGNSYIIDLLNQNVYYKLKTIYEATDTIINKKPVTMTLEAVLPVVVVDQEFPAETFANLMMCDDQSVPDVTIDLDFHLSNYHRKRLLIPLSQLKLFCRQQGCKFFFACDGVQKENVRGVMFASNLPKGYNHLFSLRVPKEQLLSSNPIIQADVYLYIPPIDKEKLFGTAPTKESGVNFKLP